MEPILYQRWLQRVYDTQDEELLCADLADQIAQYVERELAGERVAETMPQVKLTLDVCRDQCRACYELYVILRSMAALEQADRLTLLDNPRELF